MTISIGPKGYVNLVPVKDGPNVRAKLVSCQSLAAAGDISNPAFDPAMQPVWVGNMTLGGKDVTVFFSDTGNLEGTLKQNDTGTTQNNVGTAGDTLWVLYTDTGRV